MRSCLAFGSPPARIHALPRRTRCVDHAILGTLFEIGLTALKDA
jgi:hypothetical protein